MTAYKYLCMLSWLNHLTYDPAMPGLWIKVEVQGQDRGQSSKPNV